VILADENVAAAVVARLRADGQDVVWIAELSPSVTDSEVLRLAGMPPTERADLVSRLFAMSAAELVDAFTVVSRDGRVRVRRPAARGPDTTE
jgi:hypothetical protein